ncbi:hypothetical protein XA68_17794 [Ophiocordyceps unilateralis]|uniref:Zn(2)-C6 fungal-type domain-containing protein n=1 Tax=Ophiocordyceps unilateralis TaxID=268505 RepID=A0A2A9PJR6_OPHUN|nr:hypothetical protein XA68_17794 [Ophiocordyceps unilateralis]
MGASSALDYARRYLVPPDSPPELASPGALSHSSRSSPSTEQAAWDCRPLPMSGYEKGPAVELAAAADRRLNRPESPVPRLQQQQQQQQQQKLPPLSSLFGPHLRSPSDRDSRALSRSPLDHHARLSPGLGAGSFVSGFPPMASPPVSQPRSTYDVKFDPDRQSLHAFARSLSGPRSPGYADASPLLGRPVSRSDIDHRWAVQHEAARAEYSLGSTRDDVIRGRTLDSGPDGGPVSDRPRPDSPGPKTAVSELTPAKDGLGPKIWTGTHFLPRFVRRAEVPGEGMCYFYDDGSHCKTVIDGETVNAHWGVTKAGKPRKRLAIACVTCREKKIKCDPDYPRCVQCEKFGRVCKFKNAPRGGHNTSPSTPPAELDDVRRTVEPSRTVDCRVSDSGSSPPLSPRGSLHPRPSPERGYSKRLKIGPEVYVTNGESATVEQPRSQPPLRRHPPDTLPPIPDDVLSRACRTDPYGSDPESIGAVLTHFFGQIDNTFVMRFFPEKVFRSWVAGSAHEKSPEDLMVFYSVLAVGVALSGGPRHIAHEYAQVAHYAQKVASFPSLQLVQSRILLAVYHVSTCRVRDASELISSAATVAASLQLNREIDPSADEGLCVYPLGMNVVGYCEARRRTLWSLFMLERINTVLPHRPVMISADDVYVRLPADSESFEKQMEASMPLFDPDEGVASRLTDKPSEMAGYLIEMVHIWASCRAVVSRMASRPGPSEASSIRARAVAQRARDWYDLLPPRLSFGGSNLESAAFSGKVGSFLTMHLLYHHAMIHLNRYQPSVARLPTETRLGHLHECRDHALSILDMTNCLDRILRVRPTILSTSPPAMSETIVTAVDVLTACGPMASINELIQSIRVGKTAVDGTARTWEHSQLARDVIEHRLQKLIQVYHSQGSRPASPADGYRVVLSADEPKEQRHLRWHIPEPMERPYPLEMDVVYSSLG